MFAQESVMEKKQLEPVEIIRGEMGTWTHPVYSSYVSENLDGKEYISRDEWDQLKNHFNIQTVTYWMEGHVNPDEWEKMMDACDISTWDPIAPHGFFLIDIHFGEDDAYALFARNKREIEVA